MPVSWKAKCTHVRKRWRKRRCETVHSCTRGIETVSWCTFSDSIFEVGKSTASLSCANTGRIGELLKELCCFKVTLKQVVCMRWCLLAGREQGSAVARQEK